MLKTKKKFFLASALLTSSTIISYSTCYSTETSVKQNQQIQIDEKVKTQIDSVKAYAQKMKQDGKDLYLILGASNNEITSLKDQSQRENWVFWNLGLRSGPESIDSLNIFINADFNDKAILAYAAEQLSGVFSKIVIPQEPIEYTKWEMPEFMQLHNMLSPHGQLIFALDWSGGNAKSINYKLQQNEISSDMNETELRALIIKAFKFDLPYSEWEYSMRKTYKDLCLGYITFFNFIYPDDFKISILNQIKSHFNEDEKKLINQKINEYLKISAGRECSEDELIKIYYNELNKEDEIMKEAFDPSDKWYKKRYMTKDEIRNFIEDYLAQDTFDKTFLNKVYKLINDEKYKWLQREFGKIFSTVSIEDIEENDPRNDIPSLTFKLGKKDIILTK